EIRLVDGGGDSEFAVQTLNLYHRALGLFTDAVRGNGAPSADGVDGIKSLAVAHAVRLAAQTGKTERVDYGGF
ncbi:MAG: gfo/Idh/MocA family oxidoreductase, partial [Pseudomonadota bacterium]